MMEPKPVEASPLRVPARLLVYIGGIRSGKSALALGRFSAECAARGLTSPAYLGTLLTGAADRDPELVLRVERHRLERPGHWALIEVEDDLPRAAGRCREAGHDAWLLDGVGAWAALRMHDPALALDQWTDFLGTGSGPALLVLVLDEVGQGGLPPHPAARAFADLNGALNRLACGRADEVFSAQAGLALRLK